MKTVAETLLEGALQAAADGYTPIGYIPTPKAPFNYANNLFGGAVGGGLSFAWHDMFMILTTANFPKDKKEK